jgi:hypothetical protein
VPDELDQIRQRLDSLETRLGSEASLRAMAAVGVQAILTLLQDKREEDDGSAH